MMPTTFFRYLVPGAVFAIGLSAAGQLARGGQAPAAGAQGRGPGAVAPKPDNPESLAHIAAAKKIVGDDAWLLPPYNFYCVAGNARPNNAQAAGLASMTTSSPSKIMKPSREFSNKASS